MPLLDWLNKEQAVVAVKETPYKLLEEKPELSYGDRDSGNLLIQGDNLEALKALIPFYAGEVKCVFIDPPYNTGSAFPQYDDNLEHSIWLSIMYPRLELLRDLMSEKGSIWISIDDREAHYLKVICDEVFGRNNFVGNVVWEKTDSPKMDAAFLSTRHDHVLVYAKNINQVCWNKLQVTEVPKHYNKVDENGVRYYLKPLRAMGGQGETREARPTLYYPLIAPDGTEVYPKLEDGTDGAWRWSKNKVETDAERIDWVSGRAGWTPYYRIYAKADATRPPETIWPHGEVGSNRTSKKEVKDVLPGDNPFSTPKPERLLERVIQIASNPGDLVLDSFLGSGTTTAVAHKMGRRYIGIELGEHAHTHCQPRLQRVVDGEQGGISKPVKWKGGGGFRFLQLGEAVFDEYGSLNPSIKFATLAAHIWFLENKVPLQSPANSPLLGENNDTAYYLLYNGILGDARPDGGNVLTSKVLAGLPRTTAAQRVIYGDSSRLGESRLRKESIIFKQIPYDVGML